jgi:CRP-like cAMP-binding protein
MPGPTQIYGKGDVIISEGSTGDRTFKILHGEVLICKQNKDRKQIPIAKLSAGDVFGEMYLIDSSGSRSATAIALDGVVVELIFQDQLSQQIGTLSPFIGGILKGINKRLRQTTEIYVNPDDHAKAGID